MACDTTIEQMVPSGQLRGVKFDMMTGSDIEKYSHTNIVEANDVINPKLGLPNASSQCTSCGATNLKECEGHFGIIRLPATVYHPFLVAEIVNILNQFCPGCKSIKKQLRTKRKIFYDIRRTLLKLMKQKLSFRGRSILARATKFHFINSKSSGVKKRWGTLDNQTGCKYCTRNADDWYPSVKFRISSKDIEGKKGLSVAAEIMLPKKFLDRSLNDLLPKDFWTFIPMDPKQQGTDQSRIILTPTQVFHLLRQLQPDFFKQFISRRELLFLSCLPVTPNSHRVTETTHIYSDGPQLCFDERTKAHKRVIDLSRKIDEFQQHQQFEALATSYVTNRVLDCFKVSKLHSKAGAELPSSSSGMKWVKEAVLSKRVDNSFRMTMIGDPKIRLDEIGIPHNISENLFLAEQINDYNVVKLNEYCNFHLLIKQEFHARREGKLISVRQSNQLKVGDIFYKPLEEGDLILVNRPPSVHQHSLIALSVKVIEAESVISINPLCCPPLFGDFDGDCLHGYIPQSIRSRAELGNLVSLECQLFNAQDGQSLLSLTHDSLTAAYLLTSNEVVLNKFEMQQLEMMSPFTSSYPAIVKAPLLQNIKSLLLQTIKAPLLQNIKDPLPQNPLWTGQQLLGMLFPPLDFAIGSTRIQVGHGEILCSDGVWSHKSISAIFRMMFKCYGKKALDYLFSAQEVLCEYLTMRGLTVSLGDVYLTSDSYSRTKMIDEVKFGLEEAEAVCHINELMLDPELEFLLKAYDECEDLSHSFSKKILNRNQASKASISAFKYVYGDLQNVIRHYVSKENSMLAMVHAGSKGSLQKLVQQGVCLGLQLAPSSYPINMPFKPSCSTWNHQKSDDIEYTAGQNSYAVIQASFLGGLNPLECFFHALSGRANFFSENADLPGTLTRKLMFYMRDLYVAYDGTVRNAYGQQIIQFFHASPDEASVTDGEHSEQFGEKNSECGLGGQPVGSRAACAISEAAYGALDHPVNNLEDSPLLNLKKVLECSPSRISLDRTASLFLSKKLKRLHYGFEHGALEIKSHLDTVLFSDVVSTVMIFYSPCKLEEERLSPWILHFHVDKERMMRKKLKVQPIIEKLSNAWALRENSDPTLPSVRFQWKNRCIYGAQKELDENHCITVEVEDSDPMEVFGCNLVLLETIKDKLIPILLHTLIKGFLEFKKVEILCDSHHELFLKVTMSENCLPVKFWFTLQNVCIPIMNLIDWRRSHPDGVHDISSAFGIDSAWKYYLRSLKSATSDIGRSIHLEHLLLVTNSLSSTGEFHGLSIKGLKQQRDHASISAPFSQAFFLNPEFYFIDAAKKGSVDYLKGTVDSLAWGKEPSIGTAGPFDIIFSGKVNNQKKNIYSTLHEVKLDNISRDHVEIGVPASGVIDKQKGQRKLIDAFPTRRSFDGHGYPNSKVCSLRLNSKDILRVSPSCAHIVDMISSLRSMLNEYPINEYLNEAHKSALMEALNYHPKSVSKIGVGIQEIKIGYSPSHPDSRCFIVERKDGTTEDFSYRKCVIGAAKCISPKFGSLVEKKLSNR